jgi:hypothetical protein
MDGYTVCEMFMKCLQNVFLMFILFKHSENSSMSKFKSQTLELMF